MLFSVVALIWEKILAQIFKLCVGAPFTPRTIDFESPLDFFGIGAGESLFVSGGKDASQDDTRLKARNCDDCIPLPVLL